MLKSSVPDSRAAGIFDRAGLDYCCHGHDTLEDAAAAGHVPLDSIVEALEALDPSTNAELPANADLDQLTRYVVTRHHAYVREATITVAAWLEKLVARHGARHAELAEIRAAFAALSSDLLDHMRKEEVMLFPFIDALAIAARSAATPPPTPFGSLVNPIRVMEADHRDAGGLLSRIRELTHAFQPPPHACTTFRLCYQELEKFEADLHRHVHLENYILFPRAVALEAALG